MKKYISKLTAVFLVVVLTVMALSSCGLLYRTRFFKYPDGYTGGFGYNHPMESTEYAWVETYEEVEEAIALLSSHGSNFYKSAFFNYEGDLFDTKYCFKFLGEKDNVKYGDNPFDRYAEKVYIYSYAFFENVTIEELVFSYLIDYDTLYFYPHANFFNHYSTDNTLKKLSDNNIKCTYRKGTEHSSIYSEDIHSYDNGCLFQMHRKKWSTELQKSVYYEISDESLNAILNSIIVFGEKY